MGVEIQLFEVGVTRPYSFRSLSVGWMNSKVYEEKVNTRDALVARNTNSAALLKQERQDDLRTATCTIVNGIEKCIEVDGGIFEHLL
jgi:hypothetical protein